MQYPRHFSFSYGHTDAIIVSGWWALSVKLQTGFPSCGDMRVNAYFAVEAAHKSLVASSLPIAGIEGGWRKEQALWCCYTGDGKEVQLLHLPLACSIFQHWVLQNCPVFCLFIYFYFLTWLNCPLCYSLFSSVLSSGVYTYRDSYYWAS